MSVVITTVKQLKLHVMSSMSLQETLTSLPNIVLLSTGNKATTAVIHHQTVNANFVLTLAFVSLIAAPPTK